MEADNPSVESGGKGKEEDGAIGQLQTPRLQDTPFMGKNADATATRISIGGDGQPTVLPDMLQVPMDIDNAPSIPKRFRGKGLKKNKSNELSHRGDSTHNRTWGHRQNTNSSSMKPKPNDL